MHHDFFEPLRDVYSRFGRRNSERMAACHATDASFSSGGSALRRATYLGLVLAALTHASGCGSECDMSRSLALTVDLVDEAGVHLHSERLKAAFDAAKIEVCVDGLESYCFTNQPDQLLPDNGAFEVSRSDLAFPERLRCEFPSVRFSIDIPGCEPGEFVLAGEDATDQANFVDRFDLLTIVCPTP